MAAEKANPSACLIKKITKLLVPTGAAAVLTVLSFAPRAFSDPVMSGGGIEISRSVWDNGGDGARSVNNTDISFSLGQSVILQLVYGADVEVIDGGFYNLQSGGVRPEVDFQADGLVGLGHSCYPWRPAARPPA